MRKWVLAIVATLIAATDACAHMVKPIPFDDIGSLSDVIQAKSLRGAPVASARTQVNLGAAPYNAACNTKYSMGEVVTLTNSGSGLRDLAVTNPLFLPGDSGKTIVVPGAGNGGSNFTTTFTYVDATHVTLNTSASTALTSSARDLVWGTDDSAAYTLFKANYQGTTPVQLNLPGFCSMNTVNFPFKGIGDLIVSGNGIPTSGIASLSGGLLLGGSGQFNDAFHSNRTDTINPGDTCVILKTAPAVTVTNVQPSFPFTSRFTASTSGLIMTVTAVASGTIVPGAIVGNVTSDPGGFNTVQPYGTSGTTGTGGVGTYAMSVSTNLSSRGWYTAPASYTGSIAANTGVLTVTSIEDGVIAVGQVVYGNGSWNGTGGSSSAPTNIKSQLTGTGGAPCPDPTCNGGVGTYQLTNRTTGGGSGKYQNQGNVRLTLSSTTGLSSGDTLFVNGINGTGQLTQRSNGLMWIKVINSTDVDLFQWTFDGAYTSGGTAGGDRTALFPVGSKVMISGWANQAYYGAPYGYPSNPHWFEYKTVVSTNPTTHEVCVDTPFANLYKDTWPQYNTGRYTFEVDQGGPATIYVLDPSWETTVEFKNLKLVTPNGQTTANGRKITWRDVEMVGAHCAIPTQNVEHNWINVYGPNCNIETDKIVGSWNISGTNVLNKVDVQSSSMDVINISGMTIDAWYGGGKVTNFNNSVMTCPGCTTGNSGITVGTLAYGVSDATTITNTSVGFALVGGGGSTRVDEVSHPWTMSGGVITIPNAFSASGCCAYSETQTRFMAPGHYAFWSGAGGGGTVAMTGRAVKIIDAWQDTENTYIQTSDAGGFPTGAWTTNGLSLRAHPAPLFTASGNYGSESAFAYNGCTNLPMWSCINYTYVGSSTGGSTAGYGPTIVGVLDSFTFTNNVPFTNTGALNWTVSRFGNFQVLKTDLTTTTWGVTPGSGGMVNMKLPSTPGGGSRVLTQAGVTGSQTLDNLSAPPIDAWMGGNLQPIFSSNTPSDSPEITINFRTNQQFP